MNRHVNPRPSWNTRPIGQDTSASPAQHNRSPASSQRPRNASQGSAPINLFRPSGIGGLGVAFHGKAKRGIGLGLLGRKRHRKLHKDAIRGITKGDIRRLARRGGVKRVQSAIYGDIRKVMKERLSGILRKCVMYCEHRGAKTVTVSDIIFVLQRLGRPIYGFGERKNQF